MTSLLLAFTLFWNLFAPSPPGIAINPDTKECGLVFGGDEYAYVHLPPPWEIHYESNIQTETGEFYWDGSTLSAESFCKQIGYTYIPGNLTTEYGKLKLTGIAYVVFAFRFAPIIIVALGLVIVAIMAIKWAKKFDERLES